MNKISYYTNYNLASKFAMYHPEASDRDQSLKYRFGLQAINSGLVNFYYLPYVSFINLINFNNNLSEKSIKKVILFALNSIQLASFNLEVVNIDSYHDVFKDLIRPSENLNFYVLVKELKENEIITLFESIYNSRFDFHSVINACPKVPHDQEGVTALYTTFLRFLKLSQENFFRFIPLGNYKRIQNAETVRMLTDQAVFLEGKRAERLATSNSRLSNTGENTLFGKIHRRKNSTDSPLPLRKIKPDFFFSFSKDPVLVGNIGSMTGCCFTSNGLAKQLVSETIVNPLAGILTGKDKSTWFAMVWEIVLYNMRTKKYEICLVLDNIESHKPVNLKKIISKLKSIRYYKRIFLGTSRNDIDSSGTSLNSMPVYKKPYHLAGGEGSFKSYSTYDDSANYYELLLNDDDDKIKRSPLTDRNLFLSAYIERFVYNSRELTGKNDFAVYPSKNNEYVGDHEFLEIKQIEELSFIWSSKTTITGYLVAHKMTMMLPSMTEKNISLDEVIYVSDMVALSSDLLRDKDFLVKAYKKYIKKNGIKYIAFAANKNSKFFTEKIAKLLGVGVLLDTVIVSKDVKRPY